MAKSLRDIVERAKARGAKTCAVVAPEDPEVLVAVDQGVSSGITKSILIGDLSRIEEAASRGGIDLSNHELIEKKILPLRHVKASGWSLKEKPT